ncbi:hypothetical protein CF386_09095 [Paraphotobacterium marinum]|uniref:Uncharacterized protein n=1 Tax=Paraphotobacterium marinum TaxID=1755811 RepID=A0A220VFT0_9GAMM|nr:hypothetical protein [Paraphotobacterium marinum]ASK79217.1 hypothetical protein CF386_09095 [Paraphotobacterium marinum]
MKDNSKWLKRPEINKSHGYGLANWIIKNDVARYLTSISVKERIKEPKYELKKYIIELENKI